MTAKTKITVKNMINESVFPRSAKKNIGGEKAAKYAQVKFDE